MQMLWLACCAIPRCVMNALQANDMRDIGGSPISLPAVYACPVCVHRRTPRGVFQKVIVRRNPTDAHDTLRYWFPPRGVTPGGGGGGGGGGRRVTPQAVDWASSSLQHIQSAPWQGHSEKFRCTLMDGGSTLKGKMLQSPPSASQ